MMLKIDPAKRPSINQILRIDFIRDRVTKLLNEDDFKDEFSHTILHNQNVFDQFRQIQAQKKAEEETKKQAEDEAKKQEELETQMQGLKINMDYKPKYGQD